MICSGGDVSGGLVCDVCRKVSILHVKKVCAVVFFGDVCRFLDCDICHGVGCSLWCYRVVRAPMCIWSVSLFLTQEYAPRFLSETLKVLLLLERYRSPRLHSHRGRCVVPRPHSVDSGEAGKLPPALTILM